MSASRIRQWLRRARRERWLPFFEKCFRRIMRSWAALERQNDTCASRWRQALFERCQYQVEQVSRCIRHILRIQVWRVQPVRPATETDGDRLFESPLRAGNRHTCSAQKRY